MSPNRPRRLAGFSYVGLHRYFVTICTDRRRTFFDDHEPAAWMTAQIEQFFEPRQFAVISFCVMPDYVHLLLEGLTDSADFTATMRHWKRDTGFAWKQRHGEYLWQEGYYEYVLREYDSVPGVVRYIVDNPIRAGLSKDGRPYPYLGSSRYSSAQLADAISDWRPGRRSGTGDRRV